MALQDRDDTGHGTPFGVAGREWLDAVVLAGDGTAAPGVTTVAGDRADGEELTDTTEVSGADSVRQITELVEQPAKVMRIGSMIKQLLEEVKSAPLDEASRRRLKEIHRASIAELKQGLAPELVAELDRLSLPFGVHDVPSEAELRIAQAQLVGWLEGLFHGIQTALFAQQMAARAQLEQMRRALPAGPGAPEGRSPGDSNRESGGLYL